VAGSRKRPKTNGKVNAAVTPFYARSAVFLLPVVLLAEFATPPVKGTVSSARLLSAGPAKDGVYRAGVEIDLNPKTITYWRQPGEAGSPPTFDFSKSVNVAKVETFFPAPKHIDDAGTIVAGYDARVIFPLKVTPRDPKAPVTLNLALGYAACGKICLPAKADLSLALPREGASPHAEDISAAEQLVPKKINSADAKRRFSIRRGAKDGEWRLTYAEPGKALDVFPEVGEPLFIESKRDGDEFALTLFSTGPKPDHADATLTVVTDQGAFEAPARLE
jgi:hypothetical protein